MQPSLAWVGRELAWHNYMLRAGTTFDDFFSEHTVNQVPIHTGVHSELYFCTGGCEAHTLHTVCSCRVNKLFTMGPNLVQRPPR